MRPWETSCRDELNATDDIDQIRRSDHNDFAYSIERKHYELWSAEPMPVFFVLYDAQKHRGYWLDVQAYFANHAPPKSTAKTMRIHVPARNAFGVRTR